MGKGYKMSAEQSSTYESGYNPWAARAKRELVMKKVPYFNPTDHTVRLWINVGEVISVVWGAGFKDGHYLEENDSIIFAEDLDMEHLTEKTGAHPETLKSTLTFMVDTGLIASRNSHHHT